MLCTVSGRTNNNKPTLYKHPQIHFDRPGGLAQRYPCPHFGVYMEEPSRATRQAAEYSRSSVDLPQPLGVLLDVGSHLGNLWKPTFFVISLPPSLYVSFSLCLLLFLSPSPFVSFSWLRLVLWCPCSALVVCSLDSEVAGGMLLEASKNV